MADKQSREVTAELHAGEKVTPADWKVRLPHEGYHEINTSTHPSHIGVDYAQEGKDRSAITVKLDVDVSEALTGLKAVQREAKKATQALRELEAVESGNTVTHEDAKQRLVDVYKMPEAIAADCVASRNMADMSAVLTFLDRYGSMLTMPRQRYGPRK